MEIVANNANTEFELIIALLSQIYSAFVKCGNSPLSSQVSLISLNFNSFQPTLIFHFGNQYDSQNKE